MEVSFRDGPLCQKGSNCIFSFDPGNACENSRSFLEFRIIPLYRNASAIRRQAFVYDYAHLVFGRRIKGERHALSLQPRPDAGCCNYGEDPAALGGERSNVEQLSAGRRVIFYVLNFCQDERQVLTLQYLLARKIQSA